MPYSARPNSFIRLRISAVTSVKVRVPGIMMAPMFERRSASAARVTPLQIVEKAADLPHGGVAGPARQQLRSSGGEADGAGGYQHPAGLFRQLLDADRRKLVEGRLVLRRLGHRRGIAQETSLHPPVPISASSVCAGSSSACRASSSRITTALR